MDVKPGEARLGARTRVEPTPGGIVFAWLAFAVGILFTAVSLYWALGGTWLLDTVGPGLADPAAKGKIYLVVAIWAAVLVKGAAAVLPLVAMRMPQPKLRRVLRFFVWAQAVVLVAYGFVLTVGGLLVQADVIHAAENADHVALAWHTYFWDPWFLIWGILVLVSLLRSRVPRKPLEPGSGDAREE